jgi:hypothetical protein
MDKALGQASFILSTSLKVAAVPGRGGRRGNPSLLGHALFIAAARWRIRACVTAFDRHEPKRQRSRNIFFWHTACVRVQAQLYINATRIESTPQENRS